MNKKVLVAMSGGIDSSAAAFLLKKKGYKVSGVTLNLGKFTKSNNLKNAKTFCDFLNIKHYSFDLENEFNDSIINNFINEYMNGRTPNPCIICNEKIKFKFLLKKAKHLGYDFLATGHYARIENNSSDNLQLKKGCDYKKDQSYFLYRLRNKELPYILFPLGEYTKISIKNLVKENNLPISERYESQEICFIDNDYISFIKSYAPKIKSKIKPGLIKNTQGKTLGTHKGYPFYTIGQRKGLGIAHKSPLYVLKIEPRRNTLIVGEKTELYSNSFSVNNISWISHKKPDIPLKCEVKIRYQHQQIPAIVYESKKTTIVKLQTPQSAITPGQSAVFYQGEYVLGGGIIM